MDLDKALTTIIGPALSFLRLDSPQARVMMLAIGLQESRMEARYQELSNGRKGPARGLWQFERGGGVTGVMRHRLTRQRAREICKAHDVPFDTKSVWQALEHDDILAAVFARLLLWTDPSALPDNEQDGWATYMRVWRPGKPHPERWPWNWAKAQMAVSAPCS